MYVQMSTHRILRRYRRRIQCHQLAKGELGSNSVVQTLTIEQYRERKEEFLASATSRATTS
jgi:hypothetical protein